MYHCIQITVCLKQHGFWVAALLSTAAGVAFLDYGAREAPQFVEEKVVGLWMCCASAWESKSPQKLCVRNSCFFTCPYVIGTLSTGLALCLPAVGLYHSPLVCQILLENFLSWVHVLLEFSLLMRCRADSPG